MNFEKLKKFLKKNYKKIIVACLIFCLVSNKAYEKFTVSEALDGMKLTEKKVNDMYYSVDKDWNKSKKSIYSQKEIKAEGNVSANVDVIAKRNVSASGNVNAKKDVNASGNVNAKKFCIGKTCIDESHLQMLTGTRDVAIKSIKYNKYLKPLKMNTDKHKVVASKGNHDHHLDKAVIASGSKGNDEKMRLFKY